MDDHLAVIEVLHSYDWHSKTHIDSIERYEVDGSQPIDCAAIYSVVASKCCYAEDFVLLGDSYVIHVSGHLTTESRAAIVQAAALVCEMGVWCSLTFAD